MTAGTVVITGGILAAVILLCIVAVLCYCRLQYYCCKKNESEVDVGSVVGQESQLHSACNVCNAAGIDGLASTSLSLEPLDPGPLHNYCPTCSPCYLRSGLTDDMRNGGERLGFHTYHYDNPGVCLPLSVTPQGPSPLSFYSPVDMYPVTRPYSTQV
ncbi:protein FAM163A-like [Osmerus eperlanus]|uniref:protein FAM163A-like n=1 Tax=Osmerus eperlanus TaxID=29151 RepID=UPI002E12756F